MRAIEAGLKVLINRGVRYVFGIPAGSINALYDAMIDLPQLQHIISKHEASAGYMAAAYTRISGIPAICVGSSGPGATNLVTSVANAWTEKVPLIIITGSVPSKIRGRGGAQELDSTPIFASITKMSTTILDGKRLPEILNDAYNVAVSGIPGPVHLEIPIDIQMTDIEFTEQSQHANPEEIGWDSEASLQDFTKIVQETGVRGAVLVGYGGKAASASIVRFAELTGWRVATTPRGKGAFPENHPLALGVYGLAGNHAAIQHMNSNEYDVLFVVGSSLGELSTCNWEPRLTQGKKLVHLDIDASQFNKNYPVDLAVCGRSEVLLSRMVELLQANELMGLAEVAATLVNDESLPPISSTDMPLQAGQAVWNTQSVIQQINRCVPPNARFYVDIGEHMTYALQNINVTSGQDFDININFGGMGSGICGAIGAQIAEPHRPVICITGDGCFFMHGTEILTAKEYKLPLVFFVINNARLGMVHHGHMLQYMRTPEGFSQQRVNIADAVSSLGVRTMQVKSFADLQPENIEMWFKSQGPLVVEVIVDGNEIPPMGERVKFLEGATY